VVISSKKIIKIINVIKIHSRIRESSLMQYFSTSNNISKINITKIAIHLL